MEFQAADAVRAFSPYGISEAILNDAKAAIKDAHGESVLIPPSLTKKTRVQGLQVACMTRLCLIGREHGLTLHRRVNTEHWTLNGGLPLAFAIGSCNGRKLRLNGERGREFELIADNPLQYNLFGEKKKSVTRSVMLILSTRRWPEVYKLWIAAISHRDPNDPHVFYGEGSFLLDVVDRNDHFMP